MKSKPVKINGKLFRYDYENSVVEYIYKPSPEEIADNAEWETRHGYPLYHVDETGYEVLDSIGLRRENWDNRETRMEYLHGWAEELEEETRCMMDDFIKYELKYYL
mgnify:CR=1 FL=1